MTNILNNNYILVTKNVEYCQNFIIDILTIEIYNNDTIKIERRKNMTEIDRDKLLLKIYEEQKQMKKDIEQKIYEEQKQMKKDIEQKINENQQQLQKEIAELKQDVRNISMTVAKIEVEHGKKLEALFDAFTMNREKIEEHESRINNCERKIEKQDDKIYYLEKDLKQIKEAY